jgi:hypothetical protein
MHPKPSDLRRQRRSAACFLVSKSSVKRHALTGRLDYRLQALWRQHDILNLNTRFTKQDFRSGHQSAVKKTLEEIQLQLMKKIWKNKNVVALTMRKSRQ